MLINDDQISILLDNVLYHGENQQRMTCITIYHQFSLRMKNVLVLQQKVNVNQAYFLNIRLRNRAFKTIGNAGNFKRELAKGKSY